MKRIAILITCHNRKEKTLACLEALYQNDLPEGYSLHVILVDDGSTDGTSEAVWARYPTVEIIKGDGNLYWNKGMHRAFARAMEIGFDAYLWLNDDTILYPGTIVRLLNVWHSSKSQTGEDSIIVGSSQDHVTAHLTYGGLVRYSALKRLRYTLIQPGEQPVECHTMNGNCVLLPHTVAQRIGNLDPVFTHGMGDIDYGLRATKAGCTIWVAPGYVGMCELNSGKGLWADSSISLWDRWKKLLGPLGLPPVEWLIFTRRHSGWLWPLYWLNTYVKFWIKGLLDQRFSKQISNH